ncbi:MAG TPA: phosphoribosyltransferase family protein [Burkholderiaceae bacterium]|nr:phosphoribosyltransferase family protein [Burkholderiaceae bacterium]
MRFTDRFDAARQLADALQPYRGASPLVLAIPRGAVPMGRAIADALVGDFDVVLVRKLGAPWNPEFAVGAIDETGWAYVAPHAQGAGADAAYLQRAQAQQLAVLRERRAAYSPHRPPLDSAGRVAIVVDDGLATGATMIAALHSVRSRAPAKLICAVPVAAPESLQRVASVADEVVCLQSPEYFGSVGEFYDDFRQVSDAEVIECLSAPPSRDRR